MEDPDLVFHSVIKSTNVQEFDPRTLAYEITNTHKLVNMTSNEIKLLCVDPKCAITVYYEDTDSERYVKSKLFSKTIGLIYIGILYDVPEGYRNTDRAPFIYDTRMRAFKNIFAKYSHRRSYVVKYFNGEMVNFDNNDRFIQRNHYTVRYWKNVKNLFNYDQFRPISIEDVQKDQNVPNVQNVQNVPNKLQQKEMEDESSDEALDRSENSSED